MQKKLTGDGSGTPPIIGPDFASIEAAGLHFMGKRWCAWKLIPRPGGKPSKIPYRAKGAALDSQRPDEWISYEKAKSLYLDGGFSGIGYLPHVDDEIVALDADGLPDSDCTVGESGPEIVAELEKIGCYMEVSPSGRGLRAFVRGVKDGKRKVSCNGHSVEAYQPGPDERAQYVTVTGRVWGELKPVNAGAGAQQRLEAYLVWAGFLEGEGDGAGGGELPEGFDTWQRRTDDEVKRLLLGSLNLSGTVNKAWTGDTTGFGGESEARYSLIKQLWYVTRDADQIYRLMRSSKLDHRRFDEGRNGFKDFLDYEIRRTASKQARNYDLDREAKKATSDRQRASASALTKQAQEVTGGVGIDDLLNDKGRLGDDLHTASELLIRDGRLAGAVWYDEFSGDVRKSMPMAQAFGDRCAPKEPGSWRDDDALAVEAWLKATWRVAFPAATVKGAVRRWARATSINPVTNRLQQLADAWDETPRLNTWLANYMGVESLDELHAHYLSEVGKRFLIGVVARAFQPGTQQHQMLVLEGPQGAGKSAAVRALALAVSEDAYLESFVLHDSKDCLLQLRGKLFGEWAELVGFGKREAESVKDFLSRGTDEYRDPYGTYMQKWPRTVSFFATTNEGEYLRDATGNRRYWPVCVGVIDLAKLQADAPQLLGEAVREFQSGARWWVDPLSTADARLRMVCDREQRGRLVVTALDDRALDLADRLVTRRLELKGEGIIDGQALAVPDMQALMFPGLDRVTSSDWVAAAAALKRVGWMNKSIHGRRHWQLSPDKAAELRRMHGLSNPTPKGKRGLGRNK